VKQGTTKQILINSIYTGSSLKKEHNF